MANIHTVRKAGPFEGGGGNLISKHNVRSLPLGERLGGGETHPGHSWVIEPSILWRKRCDNCNRWFLRQKFYEVYDEHGWWWECPDCLIITITAAAEDWARKDRLNEVTTHSCGDDCTSRSSHAGDCVAIPIDPEGTVFACAHCGEPMDTPEEFTKTRACCGTLERMFMNTESPELRCSECGKRLLLTTHTDDGFQEIYKLWWIDSPESRCHCADTDPLDCEGHEVGEEHMDALIDYLVINRGNPAGR